MRQPSDLSAKRHAPATARNREPIAEVLRGVLPEKGRVLEIASGTGEHAVYFAAALPGIVWQPSDPDPDALTSISAWSAEAALPNLRPPVLLDVRTLPWPDAGPATLDAAIAINMIHIAPWECCPALMAGASEALKPGGALILYGAFKIDGQHTAPSNIAFEEWLRGLDPRYGVRDLGDVAAEAAARGLALERRIAMPANNFSVVFRKAGA